MYKTLFVDVPCFDNHTAHRLVISTLTHFGFQGTQVTTKQSRGTARVKIVVRHCANDHEGAVTALAGVLPAGTRIRIDHRNPFLS